MSETVKHTPGPWVVTGVSMTTGNVSVGMKEHRIVIAEVTNAASFGDMVAGAMKRGGGSFEQSDCHTQHANARLIAAAPDLLAACRAVVANIGGRVHSNPALEAIALAEEAITKAGG